MELRSSKTGCGESAVGRDGAEAPSLLERRIKRNARKSPAEAKNKRSEDNLRVSRRRKRRRSFFGDCVHIEGKSKNTKRRRKPRMSDPSQRPSSRRRRGRPRKYELDDRSAVKKQREMPWLTGVKRKRGRPRKTDSKSSQVFRKQKPGPCKKRTPIRKESNEASTSILSLNHADDDAGSSTCSSKSLKPPHLRAPWLSRARNMHFQDLDYETESSQPSDSTIESFDTVAHIMGELGAPGGISDDGIWYLARTNDTPNSIAAKFELSAHEIVRLNRGRYGRINTKSRFRKMSAVQLKSIPPIKLRVTPKLIVDPYSSENANDTKASIDRSASIDETKVFDESIGHDANSLHDNPMMVRIKPPSQESDDDDDTKEVIRALLSEMVSEVVAMEPRSLKRIKVLPIQQPRSTMVILKPPRMEEVTGTKYFTPSDIVAVEKEKVDLIGCNANLSVLREECTSGVSCVLRTRMTQVGTTKALLPPLIFRPVVDVSGVSQHMYTRLDGLYHSAMESACVGFLMFCAKGNGVHWKYYLEAKRIMQPIRTENPPQCLSFGNQDSSPFLRVGILKGVRGIKSLMATNNVCFVMHYKFVPQAEGTSWSIQAIEPESPMLDEKGLLCSDELAQSDIQLVFVTKKGKGGTGRAQTDKRKEKVFAEEDDIDEEDTVVLDEDAVNRGKVYMHSEFQHFNRYTRSVRLEIFVSDGIWQRYFAENLKLREELTAFSFVVETHVSKQFDKWNREELQKWVMYRRKLRIQERQGLLIRMNSASARVHVEKVRHTAMKSEIQRETENARREWELVRGRQSEVKVQGPFPMLPADEKVQRLQRELQAQVEVQRKAEDTACNATVKVVLHDIVEAVIMNVHQEALDLNYSLLSHYRDRPTLEYRGKISSLVEQSQLLHPLYLIGTRDCFEYNVIGLNLESGSFITNTNLLNGMKTQGGPSIVSIDWFFHPLSGLPPGYDMERFKMNEDIGMYPVGVRTYVNVFDERQIEDIENEIDQTYLDLAKSETPYRNTTAHHSKRGGRVVRTKMFFNARYLWTRSQLSKPGAKVAHGIRIDTSRVPKWMPKLVEEALIENGVIEPGFINSFACNIYHDGTEGLGQHFDDATRFKHPVYSVRTFSDSRLSFGCKLYGYSNGTFCIDMPRGSVTVLQADSYAANCLKHCIRPVDMTGKSGVVLLRHIHENLLETASEFQIDETIENFSALRLEGSKQWERGQYVHRKPKNQVTEEKHRVKECKIVVRSIIRTIEQEHRRAKRSEREDRAITFHCKRILRELVRQIDHSVRAEAAREREERMRRDICGEILNTLITSIHVCGGDLALLKTMQEDREEDERRQICRDILKSLVNHVVRRSQPQPIAARAPPPTTHGPQVPNKQGNDIVNPRVVPARPISAPVAQQNAHILAQRQYENVSLQPRIVSIVHPHQSILLGTLQQTPTIATARYIQVPTCYYVQHVPVPMYRSTVVAAPPLRSSHGANPNAPARRVIYDLTDEDTIKVQYLNDEEEDEKQGNT